MGMREERAAVAVDDPIGMPDGGPSPENVMPAQFFHLRGAGVQPEKRLMLAVLEDAVAAIHRHRLRHTARDRRLLAETEAWFASPDGHWPFAFERICEALGLDSDYIRAGLTRWRNGVTPVPSRVAFRRLGGIRHMVGTGPGRADAAGGRAG